MSDPAKTYRIYAFDDRQRAVTAELIEAATDAEAIAAAEAAGFGSKCEIWDERRLVAQLPAPAAAGLDGPAFDGPGPEIFAC